MAESVRARNILVRTMTRLARKRLELEEHTVGVEIPPQRLTAG
jgi:hypothetical protein